MSGNVKAALVGGVCAIVSAVIGYLAATHVVEGRVPLLETELASVRAQLETTKNSLSQAQSDLRVKESRLNILVDSFGKLSQTGLVKLHDSRLGWSGFTRLRNKEGQCGLQCSVDRFFMVWGKQITAMRLEGIQIPEYSPSRASKVSHPDYCDE